MKSLLKIIVIGTMLLISTHGFATSITLTADDFQANTVDSLLPKTSVAGVHGAYSYGTGIGEIYVKTDPLDNQNRAIKIYKDAVASGSYLYAAPLTGTVKTFDQLSADGQKIVLSYDVYLSGSNKNHFYVQLQYGSSVALGTIYFKTPSGGKAAIEYLVAGGAAKSAGQNISADTWYSVTYDIHQLSDTNWGFSASITEKSTGIEMTLVADEIAILSTTATNSIQRINFYQASTTAGESFSYIDNISLHYIVPPPKKRLRLVTFSAL